MYVSLSGSISIYTIIRMCRHNFIDFTFFNGVVFLVRYWIQQYYKVQRFPKWNCIYPNQCSMIRPYAYIICQCMQCMSSVASVRTSHEFLQITSDDLSGHASLLPPECSHTVRSLARLCWLASVLPVFLSQACSKTWCCSAHWSLFHMKQSWGVILRQTSASRAKSGKILL